MFALSHSIDTRLRVLLLVIVAVAAGLPATARAADAKPVTTSNPGVAVEELQLMLLPLSKAELEVEAAGWIVLLKSKVTEITERQLEVYAKNREIEAAAKSDAGAGEAEKPASEVEVEAQAEPPADGGGADAAAVHEKAKQEALESLTTLRDERAALVYRVNAVLSALEAKGGDAAEYRKYVDAVSELAPKVDVTDVNATWVAIRGWLMSKEGGMRWGRNIILFLVTLVVFFILARVAGSATAKTMSMAKARSDLLKDFMSKMVRRSVFFVGVVVALSNLDVPISPFLAAIGGAALVVGLALQGTLGNFASGIMILLHRPFDVGDVVDAAGVAGTVESMSVLSTHIRTFDNRRMVVPNNSIWGGVITNVTGLPTRRVDMVFGIGYGDDIAKAQRVLEAIVNEHPQVLKDPAPVIRVHELGDSSVNFIVRPWSKTGDYWAVYWDVTRAVKDRFDAEGISIPFPQRDVHLHQVDPRPSAKTG